MNDAGTDEGVGREQEGGLRRRHLENQVGMYDKVMKVRRRHQAASGPPGPWLSESAHFLPQHARMRARTYTYLPTVTHLPVY